MADIVEAYDHETAEGVFRTVHVEHDGQEQVIRHPKPPSFPHKLGDTVLWQTLTDWEAMVTHEVGVVVATRAPAQVVEKKTALPGFVTKARPPTPNPR